MDRRQLVGAGSAAVSEARAYALVEVTVVVLILAGLAALLIPSYVLYAHAREVDDAAVVLAQDIAYLERFAQNSEPYEGATIEVQSDDPLQYTCYSGRPSGMDPQSHIRDVLFVRTYVHVMLLPGALHRNGPLLFAHNGSVQYVADHKWADQHVPVTIQLESLSQRHRTASIGLDPFTGAVAAGP